MLSSHTLLWLTFIAYYLAVCLLHLQISNLVFVNPITTPFGTVKVSDHMETILFIGIGIVALVSLFQALRGTRRMVTIVYWLFWLVTVLLVRKFLLFHPNEYIHYPQYGILAILLALCIDQNRAPVSWGRILFWTTLMGIFDEMNQYFYLCRTHGDYLDFNDIFLNIQGAQAGLLLYYGFRKLPERGETASSLMKHIRSFMRSREFKIAVLCAAVSLLLIGTGTLRSTTDKEIPPGGITQINGKLAIFLERKPDIMGHWNKTPREGRYYVLRPVEGLSLLVFTGLLFSSFTVWKKDRLRTGL